MFSPRAFPPLCTQRLKLLVCMSTHDVLDELWPMSAHRLDGLEDVDLAVLDHLLDASVRRAVHASAALTVPATQITELWSHSNNIGRQL